MIKSNFDKNYMIKKVVISLDKEKRFSAWPIRF